MTLDTSARDALDRLALTADPDDLAHVRRYLGLLEIRHYGAPDVGLRPDGFARARCDRCGAWYHHDEQDDPPGTCPPCVRATERGDEPEAPAVPDAPADLDTSTFENAHARRHGRNTERGDE